MNSITLKNDSGETLEVRKGANGAIQIRHSDVDPKEFGEFKDFTERNSIIIKNLAVAKTGVAADDPELKRAEAMIDALFGAGIVLRGRTYTLDSEEVRMVQDAIKQLG